MSIQLILRATQFAKNTALICGNYQYSYGELLKISEQWAEKLLSLLQVSDLQQARIAFLCSPDITYVGIQWAIWRAGGVAVPLCTTHPLPELLYVIHDCGAEVCIFSANFENQGNEIANLLSKTESIKVWFLPVIKNVDVDSLNYCFLPQNISSEQPAMILYTSGTTGKPKGVVLTHKNIAAQISCLIEAWEWTSNDRILHFLPLHHTHGIINKLCCALWVGATVEMLPKFEVAAVWQRLKEGGLSIFMAVPTIYSLLIKHFEQVSETEQQLWQSACYTLRLMVSGSAALPVSVWERWRTISGHCLLERYGMTEIGMALSNPYNGKRRPGFVGIPLPGVMVKVIDENTGQIIDTEGIVGELLVRGDNVFWGYWNRPFETEKSFRADGWFCTGDMVLVEKGNYKIVGRSSTDIIKTGGYKVSALEIEDVLLTHPNIGECAVVSLPDELWGERVAAVVVSKNGIHLTIEEIRNFVGQYLAIYKLPSLLLNVTQLPRNAMGKVTKISLRALLESS